MDEANKVCTPYIRYGTASAVDEANKVCTPYIRYGTAPGFPAANCVSGGGSRVAVDEANKVCTPYIRYGTTSVVDEANEIIANKRFSRFSLQGEKILKTKTPNGKIMDSDITVRVGDGVVNLRVGAVILKDNKVLMTKNPRDDYYYSVGGRIKIGETSEQAVVREVYEELGVKLPVDRLGFINENYFYGDVGDGKERQIYEICFYYYMKTPADYEPRVNSVTNSGITETFEWIPFDTDKTIYPVFFKTELYEPCDTVKHIIADERIKAE